MCTVGAEPSNGSLAVFMPENVDVTKVHADCSKRKWKSQRFACTRRSPSKCIDIAGPKRFILQFTVSQKKVYKRCFFNTKYLPKHQGVSCCDLLHLQYLSDVSLYPSLHPTNFSSWFHYPGTEKKEERSEYNKRKRVKGSSFIIKAYAVASFE